MVILSVVFSYLAIKDYSKANDIDYKMQTMKKQMSVSEKKAINLQSYKEKIADYENKITRAKSDYDSINNDVENTIKKFCDIMSYKVTNDNKDTEADAVKNRLKSCVTKYCIDRQVSNLFVFNKTPGYFVNRELISVSYSNYDKNKLHVLAEISFRSVVDVGTEYCDCILTYDDNVKAYYISNMELIKTEKRGNSV